MKNTELSIDMLLKMTPEVFRDIVKSQPLGFNSSLSNLLKAQYSQCNLAKESLKELMTNEAVPMPTEDVERTTKTINDLYICMQLLEDRHTILTEVIKSQVKA